MVVWQRNICRSYQLACSITTKKTSKLTTLSQKIATTTTQNSSSEAKRDNQVENIKQYKGLLPLVRPKILDKMEIYKLITRISVHPQYNYICVH